MKTKILIAVFFLIIFLVNGCGKKEAATEKEMPVDIKRNVVEINLTADRIMVPNNITIKKGTAVRFFNSDKNYRPNLLLYPAYVERPRKEDIIVRSENINPGEYWEYVFEEPGRFTAKDIYSMMIGEITVE